MDGISGVGAVGSGGMMAPIYGTGPAYSAAAAQAPALQGMNGMAAGNGIGASQSVESLSSTTISAQVESFIATYGPVVANNELLGAVLLMLIMEYLKAENEKDRKDLLSLISTLAQQQQQGGNSGGVMMYSSSSLTIESTQYQAASMQMAIGAYDGSAATLQQAPTVDAGAGSINVMV